MTNDLEQRVSKVLEDYPSCGCKIGLRMARLLQQQQAEINHLEKRVNDYERRVERLEDEAVGESDGTVFARGLFSGLRLAVEIMTEGE